MDIKEKIDSLKDKQHTIDLLLKIGSMTSDKENNDKWILEPLHHDEQCSMGIVHVENKTLSACDPHIHFEAKEYLICISGAFALNIDGNFVRTVTEGECAVVNPGQMHYSKPILHGTKIAYVCVPADQGMSFLAEQINKNGG
jgi:quercetin dioxygenase-like cupin family protein